MIFCVRAILRILATIIDVPARGAYKIKENVANKNNKGWYVLYATLRLLALPLSLVSFVLTVVSKLFAVLEEPILTFARPMEHLRKGATCVAEDTIGDTRMNTKTIYTNGAQGFKNIFLNNTLELFDIELSTKLECKLVIVVDKIENFFIKNHQSV